MKMLAGAAVVLPGFARAQQAVPMVGLLSSCLSTRGATNSQDFVRASRKLVLWKARM